MTSDRDGIDPPLDLDDDGEHRDEGADPGAEFPTDDTASDDGDDDDVHTGLPPKFESWRRRSATGAILTGFALGLQQAFGKEHEQPSIVMETSGDPPTDLPVEADMELSRPRQSVVNIRPWLLPGHNEAKPSAEPSSAPGADPEDS